MPESVANSVRRVGALATACGQRALRSSSARRRRARGPSGRRRCAGLAVAWPAFAAVRGARGGAEGLRGTGGARALHQLQLLQGTPRRARWSHGARPSTIRGRQPPIARDCSGFQRRDCALRPRAAGARTATRSQLGMRAKSLLTSIETAPFLAHSRKLIQHLEFLTFLWHELCLTRRIQAVRTSSRLDFTRSRGVDTPGALRCPPPSEEGHPMRDVFDKCGAFKDDKIAKAAGLYPYFRPIEASHASTEVDIEGRRVIMVGSNNYLGLAGDPRVKEAALEAIRRFGTTCSGSRLLNGTLTLHEELESRLAKFLGREAALACSTGFQTNVATVSGHPRPARHRLHRPAEPRLAGRRGAPRLRRGEALPAQRHGPPRGAAGGGRPRGGEDHHHRRRVLHGGRPLQPPEDRRAGAALPGPGDDRRRPRHGRAR